MTAKQSTTKLKKKGRRRKAYGVPIALFPNTQILKAVQFFKKGFLNNFGGKKAVSADNNFKNSFVYEFISYLLNKNAHSLALKRKLYRSVVEFRTNYHFRWFSLKILS
jgi:hypothetical protein